MPNRGGVRLHGPTVVVLVVGLAISVAFFLGAQRVRDRDEDRLLRQRVLAASVILVSAIPATQSPLVAAAEQAEETAGRPESFERVMAAHVGTGRRFVGASLWRTGSTVPFSVFGSAPGLLARSPDEIKTVIVDAGARDGLKVINLLDQSEPRIGYASAASRPGVTYVVYAESALPADRTAIEQGDTAFADLDYAVYLGTAETDANLVIASTDRLPLRGRRSGTEVPFGDTKLHVVMSPQSSLGGSWSLRTPWLLGIGGILLTLGATAMTEGVLRSRAHAERLSAENASLYSAQRTVASMLQQSMLPAELPVLEGVEYGVRYVAGAAELEVGGDWYDVFDLGDGHSLFAVGDVSGRGLDAAIVMASLRYSIRAFANDGDGPSAILTKLGGLLDVTRDGRFATVLCGALDTRTGEVTLTNAGHPAPVLVTADGSTAVETPVGVPVGIAREARYEPVTLRLFRGSEFSGVHRRPRGTAG